MLGKGEEEGGGTNYPPSGCQLCRGATRGFGVPVGLFVFTPWEGQSWSSCPRRTSVIGSWVIGSWVWGVVLFFEAPSGDIVTMRDGRPLAPSSDGGLY